MEEEASHINYNCSLRKSSHVVQNSKLFWISKKRNANPLGPRRFRYQRLPNLFYKDPYKKKHDMFTLEKMH